LKLCPKLPHLKALYEAIRAPEGPKDHSFQLVEGLSEESLNAELTGMG
jgi:hypothetical protein